MKRSEFAAAVLQNASTVTHYEMGGSGPGGCDCIGLIIGAYRIMRMAWPGDHGTNWAARNYTNNLAPFNSVNELDLGDIVYKAHDPGESGWNLPDRYKGDPDQRDYYHVGVVTSVNPFEITDCTTVIGGIHKDHGKSNWHFKGVLPDITDGGGTVQKALVVADQGSTVNLRAQPSMTAAVLVQVPIGSEVDLYDEGDEWSKISYNGQNGYMMTKFLIPVAGDVPPEGIPPDDTEPQEPVEPVEPGTITITLDSDLAYALWLQLGDALNENGPDGKG